jgi:carbonic anhydrase
MATTIRLIKKVTFTMPSKATAKPYLVEPVPVNGLAGLHHWKQDLRAGLAVSLVSLPLSMAISVASGAPASAGLLTAFIAGLVLPVVGGSYLTIASPAAGMAPVLYQGISGLGQGNLLVGYPLILPLIIVTGLLQLLLSRFPMAALAQRLPGTVITGMLTSIGVIVLVKQLPLLLGYTFKAHSISGMLLELPTALQGAQPEVALLGLLTLLLIALFTWLSQALPVFKGLPPFFYALVLATALAQLLNLEPVFLLPLPLNPIEGIVLPNVMGLISTPSLWYQALIVVISLLVVNTVESLATLRAVDQLDPFRRSSDTQRSLFGVGACNISSGLLGGLTVIPEVIRSTVNIVAGAYTQWAAVWNAVALLLGWLLMQPLLTKLPLCVLAAVLMVSSLNLCKTSYGVQAWQQGVMAFMVYITTVGLTLGFDLMWGLAGGTVLYGVLRVASKYLTVSPTRIYVGANEKPTGKRSRR